jgi:hypothetical protein
VLAAAIGIDRTVETEIRRLVAVDDFPGAFLALDGLERRQFVERLPTVVERNTRRRLITPACVRDGAASSPAVVADGGRKQAVRAFRRAVGFGPVDFKSVVHGMCSDGKKS